MLDTVVYQEISRYDREHRQTIEPTDLLRNVRTLCPDLPEIELRQSCIRMYRKRGEEQKQHADELWLYGKGRELEDQ